MRNVVNGAMPQIVEIPIELIPFQLPPVVQARWQLLLGNATG